ncbi:uncharacterized protein BDW43DRAFT_316515 [Aspergillus alliaceus]|uniref:uncharacterized protein n=1 Tax=Petromyces alliaceus TaxID=209559 RepID=UPI0012A71490|nr:uncharacterized protein BDW43DRAFT_316515 [Aspergillus alliaceus]KAB8227712.1 hypothetical protein BDW43DRAFT_316515 [Aspergillus alliaceus]
MARVLHTSLWMVGGNSAKHKLALWVVAETPVQCPQTWRTVIDFIGQLNVLALPPLAPSYPVTAQATARINRGSDRLDWPVAPRQEVSSKLRTSIPPSTFLLSTLLPI